MALYSSPDTTRPSGHLGSQLPVASGPMVAQMQKALSSTLTDLSVREEVSGCLQSMLLDIETTHHLQHQLELASTRDLLEKAQTEQQGVILEAHAERLERNERRIDLADTFVVELLQVNQEMKALLAWKEAHAYKVRNYDALLAKLAQTEEELKEANRVSYGGEAKPRRPEEPKSPKNTAVAIEESSSATPIEAVQKQSAMPIEAPEQTPESKTGRTTSSRSDPVHTDAQPGMVDSKSPTETDLKPDAKTEGGPETAQSEEEDQKPPALTEEAVVLIDTEADMEEDVPTLMTLDVEPLMMVFGFLDAMDILNTAQINVTMYNKVDNIFGISEDGQSPPAPNPIIPPNSKPKQTATNSARKPPPPQSSNPVPSATKAAESSASSGGVGTGLFSMLQPAKPETPVKSSGSRSGQSQPLNAKVAQSMASKLSDAELAAIITMTDKLSKLEKEVHMLRNEKEVIAAKLDGTEAVKQFLIGKVRDVEVKLSRSKEDEIKVTQQIASDQEVIAFLDSRVQELEQMTENLTLEKTGTQAGFDDLKVSTSKKITMLSDMLKYEREKVREEESDWKATKKVLVKEVKSCRAQILALQAERDGLQEQNDMLKRAIVSTGGGPITNGGKQGQKASRSPTNRSRHA